MYKGTERTRKVGKRGKFMDTKGERNFMLQIERRGGGLNEVFKRSA